jgi:hypothetical protein
MTFSPVQREALRLINEHPAEVGGASVQVEEGTARIPTRTAAALEKAGAIVISGGVITLPLETTEDEIEDRKQSIDSDVESGQQQAREQEALTRLAEATGQPEGLLKAAVDVHRTRGAAATTATLIKSVWAGSAGTAPEPKEPESRQADYRAQTGRSDLTPAQRRRADKKARKAGFKVK